MSRLPGVEYKRVFDGGRVVRGRLFTAWRLGGEDAQGRVGVVAAKKCFHDAVQRNRAKRLMREAFRLLAKEGAMPAGTDWILSARSSMKGGKCADVMAELRWAAKKCAKS